MRVGDLGLNSIRCVTPLESAHRVLTLCSTSCGSIPQWSTARHAASPMAPAGPPYFAYRTILELLCEANRTKLVMQYMV